MYVGVTFTGNGPYRSEVPAVSSRSLDPSSLFEIAETAVTTGTRMFVNSLARERYPINYVYGFSSEGFSYFLTTQMKQTSPSPFHSKLVRIVELLLKNGSSPVTSFISHSLIRNVSNVTQH